MLPKASSDLSFKGEFLPSHNGERSAEKKGALKVHVHGDSPHSDKRENCCQQSPFRPISHRGQHRGRTGSNLDQRRCRIHERESAKKSAKNGRGKQHRMSVAVLAHQVGADLDHDLQNSTRPNGQRHC